MYTQHNYFGKIYFHFKLLEMYYTVLVVDVGWTAVYIEIDDPGH